MCTAHDRYCEIHEVFPVVLTPFFSLSSWLVLQVLVVHSCCINTEFTAYFLATFISFSQHCWLLSVEPFSLSLEALAVLCLAKNLHVDMDCLFISSLLCFALWVPLLHWHTFIRESLMQSWHPLKMCFRTTVITVKIRIPKQWIVSRVSCSVVVSWTTQIGCKRPGLITVGNMKFLKAAATQPFTRAMGL